MNMVEQIKYCQFCGTHLVRKYDRSKERPFCEACNTFIYADPKVAVVAIVPSNKTILLIRRAIEPHLGKWSLPSGYVDRGESIENALVREVFEETTIYTSPCHYLGVFSGKGPVVIHVYVATHKSGTAKAAEEVSEIKWCELDELPDLPFPYDQEIMSAYKTYLQNL
jgi:ADP-ribose pyrophosphatase YjhB (NUDIX family)|tara:strand:+ start:2694 stop:3194 length:501 start_codon:yes stop_codon:yes gene_type:complete